MIWLTWFWLMWCFKKHSYHVSQGTIFKAFLSYWWKTNKSFSLSSKPIPKLYWSYPMNVNAIICEHWFWSSFWGFCNCNLFENTNRIFLWSQNKKYVWHLVIYKKMYLEGWETIYIMYSALCFLQSKSGKIHIHFWLTSRLLVTSHP